MYIGLMSGTSMDSVDAALVSFTDIKPALLATSTTLIPNDIKNNLLTLMNTTHCDIRVLGETDTQLGKLFAQACFDLLKTITINRNDIIAIGCHGQTIFHHPYHSEPFTLQIGDPNIIAARTNITTITDFRRRDMALGGQAAPLAPAFHDYLFKSRISDCYIVNIGGIANITHLQSDHSKPVIGFDTGPGNTLLDLWHQKHRQLPIDFNGEWAKSGKINQPLLKKLLKDPYFNKSHPKSTGREYFNLPWLNNYLTDDITPQDIQTTLTELTAITIAQSIQRENNTTIWVCGGGAFNQYLITRLQKHCVPAIVKITNDMGIDPKWIEAMAFAWLAKQTMERKPGNMPSVTGATRASILGGIYLA